MNIIIGSKNPTKIRACEAVFPDDQVKGVAVPSDVSPQPMTDEETKRGAVNRARHALEQEDVDIGIGLEGGVMVISNRLYLSNWGALATKEGNIFTASGARIELPEEFLPDLKNGKELGDLMEEYAKKENVRSNEGAVGIFTNNLVDRSEMFTHVVKLLRGQMDYWTKKRPE